MASQHKLDDNTPFDQRNEPLRDNEEPTDDNTAKNYIQDVGNGRKHPKMRFLSLWNRQRYVRGLLIIT